MNTLINWVISALVVIIAAYILPGVHVSGFLAALITAVVIAIVNIFIRPLLVALTLPINIMTLGLFTLVINALLIMLASSVVPGFQVDNFWWALLFSLLLAIVNSIFSGMYRESVV